MAVVIAFLAGFGSALGAMWVYRIWERHDQGLDWKGNHRGYMK